MKSAKLAIIGSGPAGYTAAIYAARADLNPILFSGSEPGGQLVGTTLVENFPGWPDGIMGPDLMLAMKTQAEKFGTSIVDQAVQRVDFKTSPFVLWTDQDEYRAASVIVATGASAKWLGLPNEQRLRGHGVSACATCDAFLFKNKTVAVVGGGDSAMEESIFLSKFATQVILLIRSNEPTASKIMAARALANPKIKFRTNTEMVDVLGQDRVDGLVVRDTSTGRTAELKVDGLFVVIGHRPNTDIFSAQLARDEHGYLRVKDQVCSNVAGVFIAGDVADPVYRQAITAAGLGCMAALAAEKYLLRHDDRQKNKD